MNERYFRAFWANFVIAVVLTVTFAVAIAVTLPDSNESLTAGAIYGGNTEGGSVALMFNVYENAANVQKIADILSERHMNATFFIGGCWAAKNQNSVLRLAAAGFELGNHGYLHRDHAALNLKQNMEEIRLTERLLNGILCDLPDYEPCKLFAPPSGSLGNDMFAACDKLGYKVIMWTRDTVDWRDRDENLIFERAVKGICAGDLVLMHPTDQTVAALPRVLDRITSLGLRADCVSAVIG